MNQELDLEDLIEFDPQTGNGLKYITQRLGRAK
jgi:hypothetical protein